MKKDKKIKNLGKWIASGALVFIFALVIYLLIPKYKEYNNASKRAVSLREDNLKKGTIISKFEKENRDLQTSPKAIEKVAREKFKYCKPNEIVYYIKKEE